MAYFATEATCFGLYWPSSGFYNIKEETIKVVKKTVRGRWLRDLDINPLTTLFLVQKLFVNMEKYINRENSLGNVEMGVFSLGLHKLWGLVWLLYVLDLSLFGDLLYRWPWWFPVGVKRTQCVKRQHVKFNCMGCISWI